LAYPKAQWFFGLIVEIVLPKENSLGNGICFFTNSCIRPFLFVSGFIHEMVPEYIHRSRGIGYAHNSIPKWLKNFYSTLSETFTLALLNSGENFLSPFQKSGC